MENATTFDGISPYDCTSWLWEGGRAVGGEGGEGGMKQALGGVGRGWWGVRRVQK